MGGRRAGAGRKAVLTFEESMSAWVMCWRVKAALTKWRHRQSQRRTLGRYAADSLVKERQRDMASWSTQTRNRARRGRASEAQINVIADVKAMLSEVDPNMGRPLRGYHVVHSSPATWAEVFAIVARRQSAILRKPVSPRAVERAFKSWQAETKSDYEPNPT